MLDRLVKNLSLLLGSGVVVTLLNIGALALNARGLGPSEFGVLAIIQAYVTLISRVLAFETWQPVIRMGGAFKQEMGINLTVVVATGVVLDVAASVGAGLVGLSVMAWWPEILPLDEVGIANLYIYSFVLFFSLGGTPKGVFRLFDKFDLLAKYQVINSLLLFVVSIVLYVADAVLVAYLLSFAGVYVLYNLTLLGHMVGFLRKKGVRAPGVRDWIAAYPMMRSFCRKAMGTSMLSSLLNTRRSVELFVVGHLCGNAAAGTYSAVARMMSVISRFSEPLKQVVFPVVVDLLEAGRALALNKLIWSLSSALFGGVILVGFLGWFVADMVVHAFLGDAYSGNGLLFFYLLLSALLQGATVHFNPLIQVTRGIRPLLIVSVMSYAVFLIMSPLLSIGYGVEGVAFSSFVGEMLAAIFLVVMSRRCLADLVGHGKKGLN